MIDPDKIAELLPDFLPQQRWYSGERPPTRVTVRDHEHHRSETPELLWLLVEAEIDGETALFQLYVGARPVEPYEDFLRGKDTQTIGVVHDDDGTHLITYDAVVDPELAPALLPIVAEGETAKLARPITVEQSNTSIVYDERLILKLFRRIHDEPNPDVEVTRELWEHGFAHALRPVGEHRRDGRDLAVVRPYLLGAVDGWVLALTSLRDLFASRLDPEESGGDFAPEARRLGDITAQLHVMMGEAFGVEKPEPVRWADEMLAHLDRVGGDFDRQAVTDRYERLRGLADAGVSIRIHGDYHLGQTMRADTGWVILDFEGEPDRPIEERVRPSSPMRDVAGMARSFHYAARVGLAERGEEADDELRALANSWEQRATEAFVAGYFDSPGIGRLLPSSDEGLEALLAAFELDKAVYEVGYELGHRPDWVRIPLEAIERVLSRSP